uniref:3'-5' exonuclease domain-containing protein n=1 Tax=Steinernema glaseri TaxID=37863 RepID=A0A1I8AH05_9BILA
MYGNTETTSQKVTKMDVTWTTDGQTNVSIERLVYCSELKTFLPYQAAKKPYDVKARNSQAPVKPLKRWDTKAQDNSRKGPSYPLPLTKVDPKKPKAFSVKEVRFVSEKCDLLDLVEELNAQKEIAVDVEHNDKDSFLGMTCLIQISTRSKDYVVDTLRLWDHVHLLNKPFGNPAIVKVFHAAVYDMLWLSRDFGLRINNLFDTQEAIRNTCLPGQFERLSLKCLIETLCGVTLDKQHQTSDWSLRPLSEEMLSYAAQDTHYLLYCFDELRNRLIEAGTLEEVLMNSDLVAAIKYGVRHHGPQRRSFDWGSLGGTEGESDPVPEFLRKAREELAREVDEKETHILPDDHLRLITTLKEKYPWRNLDVTVFCLLDDTDKAMLSALAEYTDVCKCSFRSGRWTKDRGFYESRYVLRVDGILSSWCTCYPQEICKLREQDSEPLILKCLPEIAVVS